MRRELRKRGVERLKVVYSTEEVLKPIEASSDHEEAVRGDLAGRVPERRSIPGSIAFVPSVAGLIAAGEVVRDIVGPISLRT